MSDLNNPWFRQEAMAKNNSGHPTASAETKSDRSVKIPLRLFCLARTASVTVLSNDTDCFGVWPEVRASLIRFFLIEKAWFLALVCGGGFTSMSANLTCPLGNWVLDALPPQDYERLLPNVEPLSFSLGDVVYESGTQMGYVYFPTTCNVCRLYTMIDGATAEMGLVGNEGMVGVALFMGGETMPNRAVVQGGGEALRMNANAMREEFKLGGQFQTLLLRYTQALMTQISQTAVCNRLHSVEQRLCRWLLMTRDRTNSDELRMTQEFMADMLGVRREGITHAAQGLQVQGYISYVRGHLKILDRPGLEAFVCECYGVVKAEHDRLRVHCTNRRVGADRRSATDRRIGDKAQPPARVRTVGE